MPRFVSPGHKPAVAGFALVVVLGFLVLLTVLVVAFFTSVTSESATAKQYSNGAATKQLADTVVQIAMGQIKAATTGANLTWASQPGMIRTYDTSGSSASNYKLYSSDVMTTTGTLTPAQVSSDFDKAWSTKPAGWVDLNAPVADATGTANFPIIDGNNMKLLTKDATGKTVPAYLGYDTINNATGAVVSSGDGLPDVEGFAVDPAQVTYDPAKPISTSNTPVPVPVRWLYQLRDGSLIAPDAASSATATFAMATSQPSSSNPIVGRVAFWTDDETSKVNINTAAQGTYWDTPRFATVSPAAGTVVPGGVIDPVNAAAYPDYAFACYQPAQFEFQRYPGHPAQVSLSTVFPGITFSNAVGITPRLAPGGSQGGTVYAGKNGTIDLSQAPRKALYASVDEYMYSGAAVTPRQVNNAPVALTKMQLQKAKFFITADSRMPEVNLFNKPRVACWPVDKDLAANPTSPRTSAYDRLIAFCSTLRHDLGSSAYQYYFQRSNSQSPTADYATITRNQALYQYLQRLTGKPVPGFGGSFANKYPQDCSTVIPSGTTGGSQLLTEIFDYIRSTNLDDPSLAGYPLTTNAVGNSPWPTTINQFAVAKKTPLDSYATNLLGIGQVMPIRIGDTMGFGRFACVKEVGLVFVCTGDPAVASSNDPTTNPTLNGTKLAADEFRVQMMVLYRLHNAAAGLTNLNPDLIVGIDGLDALSVSNATNISGASGKLFPAPPTASGWFEKVMNTGNRVYNCPMYVDSLLYPSIRSAVNSTQFSNYPYYPFISQPFTIKKETTGPYAGKALIKLNPVDLAVRIFQGKNAYDTNNPQLAANFKELGAPSLLSVTADTTNNLYQTANISFPAGTFPAPTFNTTAVPTGTGAPATLTTTSRIEDRLYFGSANTNGAYLAYTNDTVRSMYFNGDARLAALMSTIPKERFSTYPGYDLNLSYPAYDVSHGAHHQLVGITTGSDQPANYRYFPSEYRIGGPNSSTYDSTYVPPGTTATSGDFDLVNRVDQGALINKPDEGDSSDLANGGGQPPYFFYQQRTEIPNLYTPNRIMPSPGMFGSLPTQAKAPGTNWQTLLFRPQPGHPGTASPPDHLIMDLFWMPIVEPYAISEPFSTAGKINMNYQIAPFTYITRSTGVRSAMKIEMGVAVPSGSGGRFPLDTSNGSNSWRKTLNLSETDGSLRNFREKFAAGDLFRCASQICDVYLVPQDLSWADNTTAANFWLNNLNTPENVREKPYVNLYARLTTKSNTFTVHFRVQSLQKIPGTDSTQWVENKDKVTSEYRGSSIVERYVDPDDSALVDFALPSNDGMTLDSFYRFRVISTKKFAP